MLIRYGVENYKSIKEMQVFSMVAGKHTRHPDHVKEINDVRILRGSFFFGANASGKSSFINSVKFAQDIVLYGIDRVRLTNNHFRIDDSYKSRPGLFQFDFTVNEKLYSYGFSISYINSVIEEEWLFLDDGKIKIFERGEKVTTDWEFFDRECKNTFDVYAKNIAQDKLFLSEIAKTKLVDTADFKAFKDVFEWFGSIVVITPDSTYVNKESLADKKESDYLVNILRDFDTGIEEVSLGTVDMEQAFDFLHDKKLKNQILIDIEKKLDSPDKRARFSLAGRSFVLRKEGNEIVTSILQMNHGNEDDLFELDDESDGTKRLFDLVPIIDNNIDGQVFFIDELDRSFHTILIKRFIEKFYRKARNSSCQLIASLHDSNIMDLDFLRQDEIWFIERESDHSSKIYSLNRFKERYDKKVQKDYLLGRYGAIPCLGLMDDYKDADFS